jgi:hypothetical protein
MQVHHLAIVILKEPSLLILVARAALQGIEHRLDPVVAVDPSSIRRVKDNMHRQRPGHQRKLLFHKKAVNFPKVFSTIGGDDRCDANLKKSGTLWTPTAAQGKLDVAEERVRRRRPGQFEGDGLLDH